ncbi:hypothetical protein GCM10009797_28800 [Nocardioides hwasunensis]|uniref:SDR family oxidoreductase n=2 Tax=Nocardioides hwasunensis TaxID=397258 RepID=A0ABR8MHM5_9ACTN|nr:SDR family oxidoreductase [Nocardioides hwasunensis]
MSTARGGRGGAIVNVSSRAAQLGPPGEYVDYASSKAALETLTRGLALEEAGHGVRVTGVRPGIVDTRMHASGGDPERTARLGPGLPLGRSGDPREVADAVCWLLSSQASYVTGTFVDVSGGRWRRTTFVSPLGGMPWGAGADSLARCPPLLGSDAARSCEVASLPAPRWAPSRSPAAPG